MMEGLFDMDDVPALAGTRALDLTALPPPPKWNAPTFLPELSGPVAVDLETRDPTLMSHGSASAFRGRDDAYVCGVAVASEQFNGYLPLRHEGGGNVELPVMEWLKAQIAKPDVEMICANTPYDLGWLLRDGIAPINDPWDIQGQAALLDENRNSYSLDTLGKIFLGRGKVDLSNLGPDIKSNLWRLPAAYVGPYATDDAIMTLDIFKILRERMEQEDLMRVSDVERPCLRIATEMRLRGVPYNVDRAEQARTRILTRERELIEAVRKATGVTVTPTDAESQGRAVRALGLAPPRTASTDKTSITAEWLKSAQDPTCDQLIELRRWNKARTTFIEAHLEFAGGSLGRGRIHGEFHPLRRVEEEGGTSRGTVSGRFSSTTPNLQQIPARDPQVRELVRNLFEAEQGADWMAADYSSQEPRLTVHFAYMTKEHGRRLAGAEEAVEAYAANPKLDYHQMTAELMGIPRKQAKAINLGLVYGMGGAKLCHELGLPTVWKEGRDGKTWEAPGPEGERLLNLYNEKVPFARRLSRICTDRANNNGFIRTLLGRRCRWPEKMEGQRERPNAHKALNRLIQGSAADQTKAAMVMLWREYREVPLVTVHDELGFSSEGPEHVERIRRCMNEAVTLVVPTLVDITLGSNWGEAKG